MTTVQSTAPVTVWNLPNQITIARLVLSVILFVLLGIGRFPAALVVFLFAVATDWIDGFLARRYQLVTKLGRILDPFADKLLVCGTLIFLAATPRSGVAAWVVVIVVARELLITAIRSFLESEGKDFSAKMAGKLKMVVQSALIVASLIWLSWTSAPAWMGYLVWVLALLTVLSTLQSGLAYLWTALRLVQ